MIDESVLHTSPRSPVVQRIVLTLLACIATVGIVIFAGHPFLGYMPQLIPPQIRNTLEAIVADSAQYMVEQLDPNVTVIEHPVSSEPYGFQIERDSQRFVIERRVLGKQVGRVPLLVLASLGCALMAWKGWRLGRFAGPVLLVIGISLSVLLFPFLSGTLRGIALGLELRQQVVFFAFGLAADIAPALTCAIIVLAWHACRWVIAADDDSVSTVRSPALWAACAGAWAFSLVQAIAAFSIALGFSSSDIPAENDWLVARYVMGASCAAGAGALLVLALVGYRSAKTFAWVPLLALVLFGGELSGGILILLLGVAYGQSKGSGQSTKGSGVFDVVKDSRHL